LIDKAHSDDPGVNKYLHTKQGRKDATTLRKIAKRLIKHSDAWKRMNA
jgi:hypothetical protein